MQRGAQVPTRYGSPLSGDTSATGGSGTQLVVWCRGDVQQDGSACSSIRLSADEYHLILTQNVFVDCATNDTIDDVTLDPIREQARRHYDTSTIVMAQSTSE